MLSAVELQGAEIDAPWLLEGENTLIVNGIDVVPLGQPNSEFEADGNDMSVFSIARPSYPEVLDARAGSVAMVRDFLADATSEELAVTRQNPWAPSHSETTRSCLNVILEEEREHHRYAVRDLDAIEDTSAGHRPVSSRP